MRPRAAATVLALSILMLLPVVGALPLLGGGPRPLSETGRWDAPFDGQAPAVNMVLLHDNRVLYWSGVEANESDNDPTHLVFFTAVPLNASTRVLDLATMTVSTPGDPDGAAGDLFCSGQAILPDGRVVAAGGSDWRTLPDPTIPLHGLKDTRIFDPADSSWHRVADMAYARWYPSVIEQPDGHPLVASGIDWLTNPLTQQVAMEDYSAAMDQWSHVAGGDNLLPLYPRLTILPGGPLKGDLFYDTVGTLWGPFGEHPEQALWSLQQAFDPAKQQWSTLDPSVFGARQHANSVMLPVDSANHYAPRFLTAGGTLQQSVLAVPVAEMADASQDPPANSVVTPMNHARWHANAVVLPDGKVLEVGGGMVDNVVLHGLPNQPVMPAEIYDPAAKDPLTGLQGTWTDTPDMHVPRMYHSTAILLPDGRVLAGGHVPLPDPSKIVRDLVNPQIVERRLEIYEPPYLFRGPRPVIEAAPALAGYGQTFTIQVSGLGQLDSVVLIHPGSATHAFDAGQRSVKLDVLSVQGETVTVRAPPDAVVMPPGYAMLFVDKQHPEGPVPSVAAWVDLEPLPIP